MDHTAIVVDKVEADVEGMITLHLSNEDKSVHAMFFPADVPAVISALAEALAERLQAERRK